MDKHNTYPFNLSCLISPHPTEPLVVPSGPRLSDEILMRYGTLVMRLKEVTKEANALHEENEWLRLANEELTRRLVSWSANEEITGGVNSSSNSSMSVVTDESDLDTDGFTLPKCISVLSQTYFKVQNQCPSSRAGTSHPGTKLRVGGDEKALEMQGYNQGMYKTELCNKWQETGTCSYGNHCRFAHGLSELRPIIRHPRYKTQICRLLLAGSTCPYGHRCHFRHSVSSNAATGLSSLS